MNTVLHARIPVRNPGPSPWKASLGCSWRLCANRSRPNVVALSLHVIRHQIESSTFIVVNVEYPDIASQPMQNLYVARKLPRHPRDVRLQMQCGEQSRVIQLPLSYVPSWENDISLKIEVCIEEQPTSPTAVRDSFFSQSIKFDSRRQPSSPARPRQFDSQTCFQFGKNRILSPSPKPTCISWIGERDRSSSGAKQSRASFFFDKRSENNNTSNDKARELMYHRSIGTNMIHLPPNCKENSLPCGSGRKPTTVAGQRGHNFSDFILIVKRDGEDDVEFNLHRRVLSMTSSVFRAMFTSRMRESLTGRVEISSFDVSTISLAVRHMYGENIFSSVEPKAFEVYKFGHQYDVSSLVEVSREVMLAMISIWTCTGILNFGIFFDDDKLVQQASAYMLEHFSEIVSVNETKQMLCSLSPTVFLALLDSDMLIATELEIFLVGMEWFSYHKKIIGIVEIIRRVRWPFMTESMFRKAMSSQLISEFRALRSLLKSSRTTISQHLNGTIPRRRHIFGQPMVIVPVPAIRQPPAALSFVPTVDVTKNSNAGGRINRHNIQKLDLFSRQEQMFNHEDLVWIFRAELNNCKSQSCSHQCLSVSLWLEQDETGSVSKWKHQDINGSHLFPIRVKARCMVWNNMGGQLHHNVIDFTFRSSGWASGWCVQDVLGGHDRTNAFFERLESNRNAGSVLQVAVEILKCEKG
ncbi:unnamed protein product [Agarophyton chilense]|eukprot:gb/GEZJ01000734.1/.p1 GENE.gb/GEZJ01000734.1/~~gb/GEZJ01000734.1/.p1  ORF type:complete len:695 (-),score=63.86 gb/GEZJ01000734.1/:2890-4974(-)